MYITHSLNSYTTALICFEDVETCFFITDRMNHLTQFCICMWGIYTTIIMYSTHQLAQHACISHIQCSLLWQLNIFVIPVSESIIVIKSGVIANTSPTHPLLLSRRAIRFSFLAITSIMIPENCLRPSTFRILPVKPADVVLSTSITYNYNDR